MSLVPKCRELESGRPTSVALIMLFFTSSTSLNVPKALVILDDTIEDLSAVTALVLLQAPSTIGALFPLCRASWRRRRSARDEGLPSGCAPHRTARRVRAAFGQPVSR